MESPLIVIVGETSSGKSDLAIYLAMRFNGQIISADSWSVYRHFNIGTAKPSLLDQRTIKHYLINVADPRKGFSAVEFKKLANEAIIEISDNNKIPILVGGTGLYVDSLIYDYSFLPASSKNERSYYENLTLEQLINICNKLDYDIKNIDQRNKRRVIRLLENNGRRPTSGPLREKTLLIGLNTNQEAIVKNIKKRTQKMIDTGLIEEVELLVKKFGWDIEPMKGIGYREFKDYFENRINKNELIERINNDTLKLVKKQKTWFKRNKSIQWYDNRDQIVESVTTFLSKFK